MILELLLEEGDGGRPIEDDPGLGGRRALAAAVGPAHGGDVRRPTAKVKRDNRSKQNIPQWIPFFQVPKQKMNLLYGDVQQQLCQHGYNRQDEESRQGIDGPHCRGTDAASESP